mmetsp:Transcript_13410/g.58569  ORF Transcript_13410/g.58569 Transcript_13410/m.58569 type:complete len:300 (-) Transcript_13410:85-984(-)
MRRVLAPRHSCVRVGRRDPNPGRGEELVVVVVVPVVDVRSVSTGGSVDERGAFSAGRGRRRASRRRGRRPRRPDPHRRHPQLEPVQAPVPQDDPARHPRLIREGFGPGVHDPLLPRAHVLRREPQSLRAPPPGGLQHPILRHGCSEAPEVVPADHLEVRVRPLLLQPDDVRVPAGFGVDDEAVERAVALLGVLLEDRVRSRRSDLIVVAREERDDVAGFEARARCGLEHDLRGRGRDAGGPAGHQRAHRPAPEFGSRANKRLAQLSLCRIRNRPSHTSTDRHQQPGVRRPFPGSRDAPA